MLAEPIVKSSKKPFLLTDLDLDIPCTERALQL